MARKIALFNHKGGITKTTTVFNIGWMLAEQGHRVLMVDSDPQCGLTGMVLGFRGADEPETFHGAHWQNTLRWGLRPAFEAQPRPIEAVRPMEVSDRPGLHLLLGDLRLAEYEVTLGIAQELSAAVQALQNLPGSLTFLIDRTAEAVDADYVLIDMGPGLGAINQNLVCISDFLILPMAPDAFSVVVVDSLSRVLPRWKAWAGQASSMPVLKDAAYPFPAPALRVLGTVVQKPRPRPGRPGNAFQTWMDELGAAVRTRLWPAVEQSDMLLPPNVYEAAGVDEALNLATLDDFDGLISRSWDSLTPVLALTADQMSAAGGVSENLQPSRDVFHDAFGRLALRIDKLASAGERYRADALR